MFKLRSSWLIGFCRHPELSQRPNVPTRYHLLSGLTRSASKKKACYLIAATRHASTFSSPDGDINGASGCIYTIAKTLQDKGTRLGRVYLANNDAQQVVLKDIPQDIDIRKDMYARASGCPHVRSLLDTVPERRMFVFEYLNDNLFDMVRQKLPSKTAKQILKAALRGLAALHERDITHNDIKANNIMVHTSPNATDLTIDKVQIVDLEDSAYLPQGRGIKGAQVGNIMWRSPEAHAMGPIRKPSDMFSYGIVCIYAMTQILPFAVDKEKSEDGRDHESVVIERQLSYFADPDSLHKFLLYLGPQSPWVQVFEMFRDSFDADHPREPFALWKGMEVEQEGLFKDLVVRLTNFDPNARLTAQEALEHEWFKDVEDV